MVKVPIACSLDQTDAVDRVEEWRTFLAEHVVAAEREAGSFRLRLRPTDRSLLEAVELAGREKACCGFFTFSIDIGPDVRWLQIAVPEDAQGILGDFAELLPPELGRRGGRPSSSHPPDQVPA